VLASRQRMSKTQRSLVPEPVIREIEFFQFESLQGGCNFGHVHRCDADTCAKLHG
jgi:hypothetical protein